MKIQNKFSYIHTTKDHDLKICIIVLALRDDSLVSDENNNVLKVNLGIIQY